MPFIFSLKLGIMMRAAGSLDPYMGKKIQQIQLHYNIYVSVCMLICMCIYVSSVHLLACLSRSTYEIGKWSQLEALALIKILTLHPLNLPKLYSNSVGTSHTVLNSHSMISQTVCLVARVLALPPIGFVFCVFLVLNSRERHLVSLD